jgi:hypothetical protein
VKTNAPHCQLSSPAKAGDPVFRELVIEPKSRGVLDRPVKPDDDSSLWVASRSLSSGAHSRDPLARNDDLESVN